jgi:hypothetical protein
MARKEEFFSGTFDNNSGNSDRPTSFLTGTGENAVGTQSGSSIKIDAPHDDYTSYKDYEGYDSDRYERHVAQRDEDEYDDSGRQFKNTGQLPLFTVRHKPPVLDFMVSTKDSTHPAMAAAAHAAEETRRRFGERPWASDNTSVHSTPMVNAGIKHGIIKGVIGKKAGELADTSNDMSWGSSLRYMENLRDEHASDLSQIPENDFKTRAGYGAGYRRKDPNIVKADFGTIKEEMKDKQKNNPKLASKAKPSQFEQTGLFKGL